jgi:hypothetical protein
MKILIQILFSTIFWELLQSLEQNVANVHLKLYTKTNKSHPVYFTEVVSRENIEGFCSMENCVNYIIIHGYRVYFHFFTKLI